MSLVIKQPNPALSSYVKSYWFLHYKIPNAATLAPLAAIPVPEQALYFYPKQCGVAYTLDGKKILPPKAMIAGQGTERVNYYLPEDYLMFKIQFQSGAFYRLFGTPMSLFTNNNEDAEAVLGNELKAVRERIEAVEDFDTMISIIETYLLKKIKNAKFEALPIDTVLQRFCWNNQSIDKIAQMACLSPRQFERNFLNRMGISPKFYSRIERFNQVLKLKEKLPAQSWMHIAFETGYFDHMHLLRDFKQFTGVVPSNFDFDNALFY